MKDILVFAGSNSQNSINKKLAILAASSFKDMNCSIIDLNDYPLPLYGIDKELGDGIPDNAMKFNDLLISTDGIVLSLAEHNGSYSVAFKNLFDWLSRMEKNVFKDKPMLLMSTSPGGRGGASVMQAAMNTFPRAGAAITSHFSLPFFTKNFSDEKIVDSELSSVFLKAVDLFRKSLT